ncbi:MAG: hypothetical protein Ct9H90mP13_10650 [Pseudomonadota bacterium]|nr:MAG: hypothetical protein Ct9H90mP13_10650 [Pseudomonadota bacterium]
MEKKEGLGVLLFIEMFILFGAHVRRWIILHGIFFPCKYNAGKSSDDLMESNFTI